MSKLSKKLILSVLTLVLTVVALGATTFAWFTLGNEATVGQVSGTITAGEGLEIRIAQGQQGYVDGTTVTNITGFESWYTNLPSSKLIDFLKIKYHENHNRIDLKGLTTENGVTLFGMNTSDPAAGNSGAYIEYALEVRSQTPGYLYVSSATLEGGTISWVADTNYVVVDGIGAVADQTTVVVSAADAARLSVQGNRSHVFAFQNEAGASTTETNPGLNNHTITVGNTITGKHNGENYLAPSKFGAHDYFFMKSGGLLVAPLNEAFTLVGGALVAIADTSNVKLVDTYIPLNELARNADTEHAKAIAELKHAYVPASVGATHIEDPSNSGQFIEAGENTPTHKLDTEGYAYATITVRIWIEGWDNEAYNAIFTAPLFASLAVVKKD
ncbi:MAG: hypothetical protein RBR97_15695 [Bacteroidales bacterium]|nr:hypothetical protein [Bacteroidales bacterium]